MSKDKISLIIAGKEFDKDWNQIRVTRSLDTLCGSFEFNATQRSPFNMSEWPIQMGVECSVKVAGKLVITGYIEDININYDKDSHTVQIAGRDKTADLVDCTRVGSQNDMWSFIEGQKISYIIKKLIEPHNIELVIDKSAEEEAKKSFNKSVKFDEGAPLIDSILQIVKKYNLFPITTPEGKLLLTTGDATKQAGTILERGINILSGGLKQSNKEVYSVYLSVGQSGGKDNISPKNFTYKSIFDGDFGLITRYRPLANIPDVGGDTKRARDYAYWEAKYRAANARLLGYSVQGWTQLNGDLWEPHSLVFVTDELFNNATRQFLINACEYLQTEKGTITSMQLCSPEKYKSQANLDKFKMDMDGMK